MFRAQRSIWLFATAAIVGFLAVASAPARAGDRAWSKLTLPARVRSGERVTIQLPEAPADVEEMEILLSLDGGRTFPLRITPDGWAWGGYLRWQVPNLSVKAAAMRIRYRSEGRETDGAASAPFEILADPRRAPDLDLPLDQESEEERERSFAGTELATDGTAALRLADETPIEAPPSHGVPLNPPAARVAPLSGRATGRAIPPTPRFQQESFQPLRN